MNLKKIGEQLNIIEQCKKYKIPLWECPQFLFLLMGILIIVTAITAYLIGIHYLVDPLLVAFIVLLITAFLLIIAFSITRSFERLAEANRLKSEFISIVSHQLRTPLSNLNWVTELLMSGKLGNIEVNQLEYFKILKENTARMQSLVSDLLTVSRIETARLPLRKTVFSIEDLVRDLISKFEPFAKGSKVKINFEVKESLPRIFNDSNQLRQVIDNLLDNAIRYTRDNGEIEIKISKKAKNIYFEIKDNGVGIPKKDQKYIFQKFFRSENVLKYQTQGSGLGLYISKAIIERLGGKIGFKSQEGIGSTFWFTIPIE